jgi:imidazolonepropionase-like amidohydrolase
MSDSTTLFTNATIIDSSGAAPFPGQVLIRGDRITDVLPATAQAPVVDRTIDCGGATLMSGLCDAHTHLTWNESKGLDDLGEMPVEEHVLLTVDSARTFIDHGYTMCIGAASAKPRLDVVVRDAINSGQIPGPRYLANGPEIARRSQALVPSISCFADNEAEMRQRAKELADLGVDVVKVIMSGEEITGHLHAEETYFSEAEIAALVEEAHARNVKVAAHARSAESVKICVRTGVDYIYHASYVDPEGFDLLEAAKDRLWVAPGLNWLVTTLREAEPFGITYQMAKDMGYERELGIAIEGVKEMRRRGIKVLPGGDYGFAWTPHGTYARDLQHFVELIGYTPMETIIAATAWGADMMGRPDELGQIKPGYLADLIIVDGDPLADISILQHKSAIRGVMKGGVFHREPTSMRVPVAAA